MPLSVCVCDSCLAILLITQTHTHAHTRIFCLCLWAYVEGILLSLISHAWHTLLCSFALCLPAAPVSPSPSAFSLFVVNVSLGLIFTKLGICPEYAKQFMRIVMCSDRFKAVKASLTASAC